MTKLIISKDSLTEENRKIYDDLISKGWDSQFALVAAAAGADGADILKTKLGNGVLLPKKPENQNLSEEEQAEQAKQEQINRLKQNLKAARERGSMHEAISIKNRLFDMGVMA